MRQDSGPSLAESRLIFREAVSKKQHQERGDLITALFWSGSSSEPFNVEFSI